MAVSDYCGTHAHLVAFHAVEAFLTAAKSAEDVATADDDTNLYAHLTDFLNLSGIVAEAFCVDAVTLIAHQTLTRELQEDSLKSCHIIFVFY